MDLCNPKIIKEVMAESGITFRHELGQNFLIDSSVPERISEECSGNPDAVILEIGPGIGCLTRELAERYHKVIAVEIDTGLIPVLKRTVGEYDNVKVINSDIMKIDIAKLIQEESGGREVCVCANLPYYITTPIIMRLIECGARFSSITVMVQSEVADRLTATEEDKEYGAITVSLNYYGECARLFSVPRGCFMPIPKVNSAVVKITLYPEKKYVPKNEALFFGIVRAAFDMRRKTMVNAVNMRYPRYEKEYLSFVLDKLGINVNVRGEKLSVADFVAISDILACDD
ncbi:MAG: 16S rRNA (adenine(1518)-N(6)/adenine(1519)-N(6))-dimethyltransferase RsmA [Eubacteriales bacterium]|nr:16S rRNA (adenine(1518)-N(6)/adenine(1519)-N(6))-dimethyltransferase RsmA [Eubacteriales bacterium]